MLSEWLGYDSLITSLFLGCDIFVLGLRPALLSVSALLPVFHES